MASMPSIFTATEALPVHGMLPVLQAFTATEASPAQHSPHMHHHSLLQSKARQSKPSARRDAISTAKRAISTAGCQLHGIMPSSSWHTGHSYIHLGNA